MLCCEPVRWADPTSNPNISALPRSSCVAPTHDRVSAVRVRFRLIQSCPILQPGLPCPSAATQHPTNPFPLQVGGGVLLACTKRTLSMLRVSSSYCRRDSPIVELNLASTPASNLSQIRLLQLFSTNGPRHKTAPQCVITI